MSQAALHTFSIENKINPVSNLPFGPKYGGNFTIKRPTLLDDTMIECRLAAERNSYGIVNPDQISPAFEQIARVFSTVNQLSTEKPPAWFDRAALFFDDESDMKAIRAVNEEVGGFLTSFRPVKDSGDGGERS